jgi:hypothetical protein
LNSVRRNHGRQCRRRRNAAFGENGAEFFQCPLDAHSCGVLVEAQLGADFGKLPVFKIAQQNGFAVGFL